MYIKNCENVPLEHDSVLSEKANRNFLCYNIDY